MHTLALSYSVNIMNLYVDCVVYDVKYLYNSSCLSNVRHVATYIDTIKHSNV